MEDLGRLSWARVVAVLAVTAALAALAPGLTSAAARRPVGSTPHAAAPDQVFPNDPGFAGCETQDPITGCTHNEQWDLFGPLTGNDCPAPGNPALVNPHPDGGLPCWALKATDPQHSGG